MNKPLVFAIILFVIIGFSTLIYANSKTILKEKPSPYDHIKESQIEVLNDKIIIYVDNPSFSKYADTNSMDPLFDKDANGLEIIPQNENDIHVGDVIAYQSSYVDGLVVHRVIEAGNDAKGKYFILKGDNNPDQDPEKIRFDQIKYLLIGVIY